MSDAKVTAERKLHFEEVFIQARQPPPPASKIQPPDKPHLQFYITVDGDVNHVFDPNNPPDIITNRGAVEDWTIANRTSEVHEFHMHQIHFLLLEVNGKRVAKKDRQFYDTYQLGYWDPSKNKKGYPIYPNIKVRMDFRGAVTGDFVYHCHILDHEDLGMMAIIRVLPKNSAKTPKSMSAAAAARGIRAAM